MLGNVAEVAIAGDRAVLRQSGAIGMQVYASNHSIYHKLNSLGFDTKPRFVSKKDPARRENRYSRNRSPKPPPQQAGGIEGPPLQASSHGSVQQLVCAFIIPTRANCYHHKSEVLIILASLQVVSLASRDLNSVGGQVQEAAFGRYVVSRRPGIPTYITGPTLFHGRILQWTSALPLECDCDAREGHHQPVG